jgi:hypothetical protein
VPRAAVSSAHNVLLDKPNVFIETVLRLASKFMGADDYSIQARIVGVLLPAKGGGWTAA